MRLPKKEPRHLMVACPAMSLLTRRAMMKSAALAPLVVMAAPVLAAPEAAPTSLVAIADGIYASGGVDAMASAENHGAICNIGVIVGSDAIAVVDSGGSLVQAQAVVSAIKAMTPTPIRYLINTHMHPDHIFGNAVFKQLGATIIGHRNLPRALEARGAFYLQSYKSQLGEALMAGIEIVPPSETVADVRQIDLGGRVIELRAWKPAHTDNDLTVLDTRTGTFFSGDLVFQRHLPTLDGSLLGWIRQMDELAAVKAGRVVAGHGPVKLDWPNALDPERAYFEVLVADLRAAIAQGTPLATAVKTAGQSERTKWALFDEFNERNATAAYAELEWE